MTTNLDSARMEAKAKARAHALAAGAAKTPAAEVEAPQAAASWPPARPQSTPAPAPAVPLSTAAKVEQAPAKLQQFNVRLTPEAKARLHGAALACHLSDQEFLERWALTLPAPEVPKMPWEV